jgi:S13-like protein
MSPTASINAAAGNVPQHMLALRNANTVRLAAAQLLREVRSGHTPITEAVFDERAQPLRVGALLKAQVWWGDVKVGKVCKLVGCSPGRRVRDLTPRQVRALEEALR